MSRIAHTVLTNDWLTNHRPYYTIIVWQPPLFTLQSTGWAVQSPCTAGTCRLQAPFVCRCRLKLPVTVGQDSIPDRGAHHYPESQLFTRTSYTVAPRFSCFVCCIRGHARLVSLAPTWGAIILVPLPRNHQETMKCSVAKSSKVTFPWTYVDLGCRNVGFVLEVHRLCLT